MPDLFADLLSTALVGTERRAVRLSGVEGPLAGALAAVPAGDPPAALLDAAALATVHRRAGVLPATDVPLPEPAPAEVLPEVSVLAARRLVRVLSEEPPAMVVLWLEHAAGLGLRVPAEVLPELLAGGRDHRAVRDAMLPVGGRRMRWLAAQNPSWRYLSRLGGAERTVDDADWKLGDDGRRLDHLHALRGTDPAAARGKLAADWASERPETRAALLGTFRIGLSAEDEEFLEAALDDRRKEVREVAAELLAELPGSAFQARMAERVAAWFRPGRNGRPVSQLPGSLDAAARRDGLPAGNIVGNLPVALVAAAPLSAWERLGVPATALVRGPVAKEERGPFRAGLIGAVRREGDLELATLLLTDHLEDGLPYDELVPGLPAAERCHLVARALEIAGNQVNLATRLVTCCPRPWSDELAATALRRLRALLPKLGYRAVQWCDTLGEQLPAAHLPSVLALVAEHEHTEHRDTLDRLHHCARLRLRMYEEFA